jgi:putative nucleotidyltransferase-like protein
MSGDELSLAEIEASLKKAASALKAARVPFLVGGSLACWARGGPEPHGDLDFMVKPEDAERALEVLSDAGMKPEHPPEDWLVKAWDGDVLIDLIFNAIDLPITDEVIAKGDELNVFSIQMPVMALEDVITTKLLALNDHYLEYHTLLQVARSLREQVDWAQVRARTASSPYARAFFGLLGELKVLPTESESRAAAKHIRVLSQAEGAEST